MYRTAIIKAILVAGTLDIASAIILTRMKGRSIEAMLSVVASGPFGNSMLERGLVGAAIGLLTHFGLMAIMVVTFAAMTDRLPIIRSNWIGAGILYGLIVYAVMYWLVIPMRWPNLPRPISFETTGVPILVHITLVGLPIAAIIARVLAPTR